MSDVELLWDCRCQLGEGAFWNVADQSIYFVDIKGQAVMACDASGARQRSWAMPQMTGWVMPQRSGGWLAGFAQGVATVQLQPNGLVQFDALHRLHEADSPLRLNDAKADRQGRLWFGSMNAVQEDLPQGVFYRWVAGSDPLPVDTGYGVTNGPTFSPDGRTLYHTDSVRRTVYAFDVSHGGALTNKRIWLQLDASEGSPDGMTTDAGGHVWVAHWGGSCVTRHDARGKLLRTITLPVPRVTNVAFGGPALRDLFITTARTGLDDAALAAAPLAGGLFVLRDAGLGMAPDVFAG